MPLALRQPLHEELERMGRAGIIKKQSNSTDWVSRLVFLQKKDHSLRVCMNPTRISEHIKGQYYQLPENIEAAVAGAACFRKLDLNSGFHQVPLNEQTSKKCSFATVFDKYCYLRLPFSISSALVVFQQAPSHFFDGLPDIQVYIDDNLVWGKMKMEHYE